MKPVVAPIIENPKNRIINCFREEKQDKKLVAYFMAGDPHPSLTREIVLAAVEGGVDVIELGIPFSDPLADGPVIEQAGMRALAQGTNPGSVLEIVAAIREKTEVPIILMTYYNPIFRFGTAKYMEQAAAAGVDGFIIPDAPFGEDEQIYHHCKEHGLELIPLVAASTNEERLKGISARQPGFIYCISRDGTTGVQEKLDLGTTTFLANVKKSTQQPVVVGFGIANGEQAGYLASYCDGVVVGSALVRIVGDNIDNQKIMLQKIREKTREFKQSMNPSRGMD